MLFKNLTFKSNASTKFVFNTQLDLYFAFSKKESPIYKIRLQYTTSYKSTPTPKLSPIYKIRLQYTTEGYVLGGL